MFACDFSLCLVLFRLLANLAVKKCKTWIKWTKQKARPRKPEPFHHDLSYQQQGMCLAAPEEKKKKEKSNEAKAWTQNNCCCWQRDCRSWRDPRPSPTADPTPTIMTLWGDLAPHQNWQLFEECDFLPKTGPVLPVISARPPDGVNTQSASQGKGQVHANRLVFPHFYSFMSCFEIALLFDDSSRSGSFFSCFGSTRQRSGELFLRRGRRVKSVAWYHVFGSCVDPCRVKPCLKHMCEGARVFLENSLKQFECTSRGTARDKLLMISICSLCLSHRQMMCQTECNVLLCFVFLYPKNELGAHLFWKHIICIWLVVSKLFASTIHLWTTYAFR